MSHYLLVLISLLAIECLGLVGCITLYQKAPTAGYKKIAAVLFVLLAFFFAAVWYGLDVNPRFPAVVLSFISELLAFTTLATMTFRRRS